MNPIQKIYRLLLFIIIGLLALEILPFLSSIIGMLIFSFLFTTIFLQGVDSIERYTRSRSLGVFLILSTTILVGVIFIGSFISNLGSQIKLFTKKIQRDDFEKGIENLSSSVKEVLPDFIGNLIPETEKIVLGSYFHTCVLEPHRKKEYEIWTETEIRSKAYKERIAELGNDWIMKTSDAEKVHEWVDYFNKHTKFEKLIKEKDKDIMAVRR